MPNDGLRPPEEYAHLRWHWLQQNGSNPEPWEWRGDFWAAYGIQFGPEEADRVGYRYIAPAVPLAADEATVERIASIIWSGETHYYSWSEAVGVAAYTPTGPTKRGMDETRARARAVIAAMMETQP